MSKEELTSNLSQAVRTIKTAILQNQYQAARGVNRVQLSLYFGIGKYISENTRHKIWGTNAIGTISQRLQRELPGLRGFGERQIRNMLKFYEVWSEALFLQPAAAKTQEATIQDIIDCTALSNAIRQPVAAKFQMDEFFELSFTHHVEILDRTSTFEERIFYIHQTHVNHWSKYELRDHLKWDDFHHQGAAPNNFAKSLTSAQAVKAICMFKDEYMLDFINVEELDEHDRMCINERILEQDIIHNIKKFIMAFGRKFCFIGNQYHLRVAEHDFYIDLLFFNRELNCLVAIELKAGEFKPPYLGELQTYLRILDEHERQSNENPSVGLILCKQADKNLVEYVIQDYNKPMGVATYSTSRDMPEKLRKALPDIEELKKLL